MSTKDIVERLRKEERSSDCRSCNREVQAITLLDAADEIERLRSLMDDAEDVMRRQREERLALRSRLAEAEALRKDAERWRHEWQRECADTDLLLQGMGLCPSEYRSEGGSLLLGRISHKQQRGGLS